MVVVSPSDSPSTARYFSVSGASSSSDGEPTVEVGPGLGLEEGGTVLVGRPHDTDVGLAVKVVVRPASLHDWHIMVSPEDNGLRF